MPGLAEEPPAAQWVVPGPLAFSHLLSVLIPVSVWETKNPASDSPNLKIDVKRSGSMRRGEVIAHGYLGHCRVHWADGVAPENEWIDLAQEEYMWIVD